MSSLQKRFGPVRKLHGSQSLYALADDKVRLYIRYSRIHAGQRTFYGLRKSDLRQLEGHESFICFLWEHGQEPLIVPFADYEDVFSETTPAADGQYKTQVFLGREATELYIARTGRFNVDANVGWFPLERALAGKPSSAPPLTHPQVQALLGSIGTLKRFDVWIPRKDRKILDWSVAERFVCANRLPYGESVHKILDEIDVIWVRRGSHQLAAVYEIEHSTPIFSGLLRLNDVHLVLPSVERLSIVANEERRSLFVRQLRRDTFLRSGLSERCTFLEYADVWAWYQRLRAAA